LYENNYSHSSNENETAISDDLNGREEMWVVRQKSLTSRMRWA